MNLYLASTHHAKSIYQNETHYLNESGGERLKIYVLESFFYIKKWMPPFFHSHWNFMLDSGAFTFFGQKNAQINWLEYLDKYAAFIVENNINHFFELDIDAILGIEKVEQLRQRLESLTGKQSIPVWRPSRGIRYWDKIISEYKYVAISASGNYDSAWTRRKESIPVLQHMISLARKAGAKVHGLGYTSLVNLPKIPFDSVDSTAWIYGNLLGRVCRFDGQTITYREKGKNQKLKTNEAKQHNFGEWLKFQRYAKNNL